MIDPVLLRSFVAVADTGNFTRAAAHLNLTQSTVSQQIMRLEQSLDCQLLDRRQRLVQATEAGERLLGYARRILSLTAQARQAVSQASSETALRLGVPEDFAGVALMPLLAAFAKQRPHLRLEVNSGLSSQLLRSYRSGELDILLAKQWGADSDCHARWPEPLCWVESRSHPWVGNGRTEQEPLPLAVFPVTALYRQEMIQALESRGLRWRVSYSSASLASLCTAVSAGLGISLLPRGSVQADHRVLGPEQGLPTIGGLELALYARPELDGVGHELRDRLQQLCAQRATDNGTSKT